MASMPAGLPTDLSGVFSVAGNKRREAMWLWEFQLRPLGLRRLSDRYWQCERCHGLPDDAYLSVFAHAQERQTAGLAAGCERVDVCAFHVTFCLGVDRVHFYYHERAEGVWEPGGHTSGTEIRRYRRDPAELRAVADRVASEFLSVLGMALAPRAGERRPAAKSLRVMSRDSRPKRDVHAIDGDGMVLCNPRDKEAAHRAQVEGVATDDRAAVTCRKCRALLYRRERERKQFG